MNKKIGVIGCGWLGLPLAISFVKKGYTVHGTTTSEEKIIPLTKDGITPFLISLSENAIKGDISGFLKDLGVLVVNVPPRLRGKGAKESYVKKMHLLHQEINNAKIDKIIFVSSTSVYGTIEGDVSEKTTPKPVTESGRQLLAAEELFKNDTKLQTTIIRFGGLIGPERHPVTMLSGRQGLSNGKAPVNLIHLNDCINIIQTTIFNNWWNIIFNGVYPYHPSKEKYYTKKALELRIQAPDYKSDNSKKGKIVHSETLINVKNYQFITTI